MKQHQSRYVKESNDEKKSFLTWITADSGNDSIGARTPFFRAHHVLGLRFPKGSAQEGVKGWQEQ